VVKFEVFKRLRAEPPARRLDLNFEVITWSTSEAVTCLEQCFEHIDAPLTVLRADQETWQNTRKPELALEHLRGSAADYIIGLDAYDVLCTAHPEEIAARFIAGFESQGAELLFNAANIFYPLAGRVPALLECEEFERGFPERHRHLNAGCWVGRREFVLGFLEEVISAGKTVKMPIGYSTREQPLVRYCAFPHGYPEIDTDRRCEIFQHMNGAWGQLEGPQ